MTNLDLDFLKRVTPGVRGAKLVMTLALLAVVGFTSVSALAEAGEESASAAVSAPRAKKTKTSKSSKKASKSKSAKSKASVGSAKEKTGPSASKGKLSRDVVFDGSVVNGKYLASGEAVSTVENEKKLNNLIGMRADFKDRLGDQRAQLRSASDK